MSTVRLCDRCGAIIGKTGSVVVEYESRGIRQLSVSDLCEKCRKDFKRFINMENIVTNVTKVE